MVVCFHWDFAKMIHKVLPRLKGIAQKCATLVEIYARHEDKTLMNWMRVNTDDQAPGSGMNNLN